MREAVLQDIFARRVEKIEVVVKRAQLETGCHKRKQENDVFEPFGQIVFDKLGICHALYSDDYW